ncbi:toprim domain-containing protein [Chitinophaga polysaccharea]|uniref:CHC2 zinc finger domain-containing protein n=1 Tax=Chitinophaga polysaccharea TaxID=1293035 RepID=UPI001455A3AD|nr:CHC2 zinc finger domain-containing protein [Chitinophaga polysaccharea]NLR59015.1 toprim domain-containing protein [Chitinophaga polysaccharea]NLR59022.1 toprim domain-containing protein [Chitinophaga polysaccharea]
MEIKDIKQQLAIGEVLSRYGLQPDKYHRILCPFHPDKTPSLQLYPKTDTYHCFSSNCNAGTGDVIKFIQLMEKCSTHEAIMIAKSLLGAGNAVPQRQVPEIPSSLSNEADLLEREALIAKVFSYFKKALPASKKAMQYLQGRSIDYGLHDMGYNSGGLHTESKNHHLVNSMVKYGLLKANAVHGYSVWAKECVIFPLRNYENKIGSLYGRSISNNEEQRHFYLTGRSGLYPCYPTPAATRLILTESVIDAASLLQQAEISTAYEVLALYGTNGFTTEHQQAIIASTGLQEIIFMLDGDDAGKAATTKHSNTLLQLLPRIKITTVTLPDGEDINSVLQSHDDSRVLVELIEGRQPVSFYVASENVPAETLTAPVLSMSDTRLNTVSPELLIYDGGVLLITVLGGIKVTGLDRLRVTLKIEHKQKQLLPLRHHLDLYNHSHTQGLISQVSASYDMSQQVVTAIIAQLTNGLEGYRLQRMESLQPKPAAKPELSPAQREAAINYLKAPDLLKRTGEDIGRSGLVGEEVNRMIAYLVYSSRKQHTPLHIMFLGSSGSGKTYLQERVSDLIPAGDKIEITQITENAFYYFKQDELKHKLLLIEDLDGAETSLYPLRELQSKKRITKTVTLKDNKGNLKTVTVTVDGPVSVSGCTTREKLYEDNANRCLLLYVDASKEQDRHIMEYQTRLSAGAVNHSQEQAIKQLFRNVQQVLQPVRVVNPYAGCIHLPEQIFKPRRTMTLLLSFIETITFYHQYQREVKRDSNGQPYIETTPDDIAAAFDLLKEVMFSKGDELAKATRNFLELLKALLKAESKASFTAKEIREILRINPGNLKRYLSELERYGYLKGNGNRYRHYEYTIVNVEEYEVLKSSIDKHLQGILATINQQMSGSVVQ